MKIREAVVPLLGVFLLGALATADLSSCEEKHAWETRCDHEKIEVFTFECIHVRSTPDGTSVDAASGCFSTARKLYCDEVKGKQSAQGKRWEWREGKWHLR